MPDSDIIVTAAAISKGRACGIYGDTAGRIRRMAARAARFTHEQGNRRYQDFVIAMENKTVTDINLLD